MREKKDVGVVKLAKEALGLPDIVDMAGLDPSEFPSMTVWSP
jgi:hypothetical protein